MVLPDVQATGAAVEDDQSRYVEMCRQMYGYEKIEIAVRQLEDWAACVVGVVAAEGGVDVTGLGRAGARLQSSDNVLAFGAVDRLSRVLVCRGLIAIVACWRADVLASRERAVVLSEGRTAVDEEDEEKAEGQGDGACADDWACAVGGGEAMAVQRLDGQVDDGGVSEKIC